VDITVGLEVSNIAKEVTSKTSNTLAYQIGTRNASTALRLHDGETQVLGGLLSDEDRRTADRVPGIGDLPVLGRLFSSTHDSVAKTEIILLITPRIVRTLNRPDANTLEFAAGTETSTGAPGAIVTPFVVPKPPATKPAAPAPGSPGGPPTSTVPPASSASPTVSSPVPAPITAPSPVTPPGTTPGPSGTPMVPFGGVQTQP
jgi:general secretion pathway protein D